MIHKLLSPEVQKFIKDHQFDDPFLLSLNAKKYKAFPLRQAIEQIQSFQKAKLKHPEWAKKENIIWPSPISIEQSSSEITAKYKATLIHGETMIDLTGGMGIDTYYFSNAFGQIDFVETSKHLCELAKHNFSVLKKNNINILHSSAEDFIDEYSGKVDTVYIDPSRRVAGGKVFKIHDCSPDLYSLVPKCKFLSDKILVKLSPLVDLSLLIRDFQPTNVWVVAVKNEVKEVLCLIEKISNPTRIHAIELSATGISAEFKFFQHAEANTQSEFSLPQKYLYEPNAAILKAGAFKLIGKHYGLKKLNQHTHLYTSDEMIKHFPGKILVIKKQLRQDKKEIKEAIPDGIINVITRNFPLKAEQLKKKFGLKDGGENFLIGAIQVDGRKVLMLCERV